MSKRYLITVELIWAAIGTVCLAISIREFINSGRQSWIFLIMGVFSLLLAGLREYQRKKS